MITKFITLVTVKNFLDYRQKVFSLPQHPTRPMPPFTTSNSELDCAFDPSNMMLDSLLRLNPLYKVTLSIRATASVVTQMHNGWLIDIINDWYVRVTKT